MYAQLAQPRDPYRLRRWRPYELVLDGDRTVHCNRFTEVNWHSDRQHEDTERGVRQTTTALLRMMGKG